jgi:hypothetical protein
VETRTRVLLRKASKRNRNRDASRPEILERVDLLGLSDADVERLSGLPQAFLSKARAGKNDGPRALRSWARLEAWLLSQGVPVSSPSTATEAYAPKDRETAPLVLSLLEKLEQAHTLAAHDEVARGLVRATALGLVRQAKNVLEALRERRIVLEKRLLEEASRTNRAPLRIVVEWHGPDWRAQPGAAQPGAAPPEEARLEPARPEAWREEAQPGEARA